jgi:hypothetical protein
VGAKSECTDKEGTRLISRIGTLYVKDIRTRQFRVKPGKTTGV